ncbi:hypothetical protein EMIHUDRAFT_458188 [Emiliania huxleyi CCMP1516]|uniref:ABC transmembrane type-1 domain-containing protein n=2 Tax=Emiliania huxleyi TaxID=2903 RepID=A0A0D3JFX0_EMIH1|nr:hypothetical protein EMIHUDRAFT_458188 [Emiliania huxleyi CCMP1516]EOD22405.1 hypothetical protein EMIHUDRAFT_458188 [Emiliania huxleyi CCMP1516]|eukprot:XP_005774834.1 hypothetical protein EMIHUDRAFT_458188 [Emiliania huxleyi CCMP1516]
MQLADGTQIVRSPRSDTAMQQPAHLRHTQRTAQTASETGTAEEASETLSDPGASGELLASSRPMGLGGHALLLLALLSGSAVGLLFFSLLGYGVEVYRALASVDWWLAPSLVVGALLLLVALYALDARYWKGAGRIAAYFPLLAAAAGSLGAACLLGTKQYPYAPLLCVFLVPTLGLLLLAVAVSLAFAAWVFWSPAWGVEEWEECEAGPAPETGCPVGVDFGGSQTNMWFGEARAAPPLPQVRQFWRYRIGCDNYTADTSELEDDEAVVSCHTGAFLWWSFPMWALLFALLFYYLAKTMEARDRGSSKTRAQWAIRLFLSSIIFFMAVTWCAASVAGAGLGVARTVEFAMLLFIVVTTAVVGNTVGWGRVGKTAQSLPIYRKLASYSEGFWDYVKAFALWGLGWLAIPTFLALSAANQAARKALPFTLPPDAPGLLTAHGAQLWARLRTWHWASVISKTTFWSLAYLILQVIVMQLVVVFFAFLNEALSDFHTGVVCAIFAGVGLLMFMIPIIPGVPVYIACGAVIPASTMSQANPDWSDDMKPGDEVPKEFWVGLVYATLVGFALKLTAVALEQELIGRQFGNYVAVRSFIRINSLEMRATRRILRRPGINTAKCAILVGGPDWPTSVTTGILKLNLLQMLLGTTPILPLIAASTAAGGMQLLKTKGDLYDSITVIVTFLSFLAQTASTLLAMYFIERTSTQYAAELAAEPPDEEAAFSKAQRDGTNWSSAGVPLWPKVTIITSALMLAGACYLSVVATCFEPFSVSQRISDLPGGTVFGLVRPMGWVVIGLFVGGWVLRYIYRRWAVARARSWLRASTGPRCDVYVSDSPVGSPTSSPSPAASRTAPPDISVSRDVSRV